MRRVLLTALLLVALPGMRAEAQSCNGCGINYVPPAGAAGLTSSGTAITSTLPLLLPDGSAVAGNLSMSFTNDLDNGFFYAGGEMFYANNTARIGFSQTQVRLNSTHSFGWSATSPGSALDLLLTREAGATLQQGADAATATAQTIKGPDSTGANVAGANLTLRAGAGTSGNAKGGQLILGGGANAGTEERGAVAFEDGGTKPTCAAGIRGSVWYDAGGAGVADTFEVCAKAAADSYAWRVLATIP